ncbi:MAG TPA: hypothetical protein EYP68_02955 [Candidatus Korarchaeota archaeon]|nr:hypothetical protein [Candidatus Korarchaeota archaeon]
MPRTLKVKLCASLFLATIIAAILSLYLNKREPSLVKLLEQSKTDPKAMKVALEVLRKRLNESGSPIIEGSNAIFVYISEQPVEIWIAGDWNGWSPSFDRLSRLGDTEIYYIIKEFPDNARVEYKLIVGDKWMSDPLNEERAIDRPDYSVLMMPNYRPSPYLLKTSDLFGDLTSISIESEWLGRNVSIHIYTPPNFDRAEGYPAVYFQDGSDYIKYGAARILDVMILNGEIKPLVAVFIDPAFRSCEYAMDDSYVNFLTEELIPFIEERYGASRDREKRCINSSVISFNFINFFNTCFHSS